MDFESCTELAFSFKRAYSAQTTIFVEKNGCGVLSPLFRCYCTHLGLRSQPTRSALLYWSICAPCWIFRHGMRGESLKNVFRAAENLRGFEKRKPWHHTQHILHCSSDTTTSIGTRVTSQHTGCCAYMANFFHAFHAFNLTTVTKLSSFYGKVRRATDKSCADREICLKDGI